MSIVTMKKKTATKYNNMSVNVPQFSLNGGRRSQGWVGQTTLSRSLPNTPMKGNIPKGHGGCCGTYPIGTIVQSAVTSTNDPQVIKPSSLDTSGMLMTKYRWIRRPAPYTSVKPSSYNNLQAQSDYIRRKTKYMLNAERAKKEDKVCDTEDCVAIDTAFQDMNNQIPYCGTRDGEMFNTNYTITYFE